MKKMLFLILVMSSQISFSECKNFYRCTSLNDKGEILFHLNSKSDYNVDLSQYRTRYPFTINSDHPYIPEQTKVIAKNTKGKLKFKTRSYADYATYRLKFEMNKRTLNAKFTYKLYDFFSFRPLWVEKDQFKCTKE